MDRDLAAAIFAELERAGRRRFAPWMTPTQLAAVLRVPPGDVRRSLGRLATEGRAERALLEAGHTIVESWRALGVVYLQAGSE